ncbi:hypothetical protein pb186bvf_015973 [Paramecium bursaria]
MFYPDTLKNIFYLFNRSNLGKQEFLQFKSQSNQQHSFSQYLLFIIQSSELISQSLIEFNTIKIYRYKGLVNRQSLFFNQLYLSRILLQFLLCIKLYINLVFLILKVYRHLSRKKYMSLQH